MKKEKTRNRNLIVNGIIIILVIAGVGIYFMVRVSEQPKEKPKIGDIIQNPSLYEEKVVIIGGEYGGWIYGGDIPVCNEGPKVTRSDWCIYDETGCIYVSAGEAEILELSGPIDPEDENCVGTGITIRGTVKVSDKGMPYIS
jgi:hypothetical protein